MFNPVGPHGPSRLDKSLFIAVSWLSSIGSIVLKTRLFLLTYYGLLDKISYLVHGLVISFNVNNII